MTRAEKSLYCQAMLEEYKMSLVLKDYYDSLLNYDKNKEGESNKISGFAITLLQNLEKYQSTYFVDKDFEWSRELFGNKIGVDGFKIFLHNHIREVMSNELDIELIQNMKDFVELYHKSYSDKVKKMETLKLTESEIKVLKEIRMVPVGERSLNLIVAPKPKDAKEEVEQDEKVESVEVEENVSEENKNVLTNNIPSDNKLRDYGEVIKEKTQQLKEETSFWKIAGYTALGLGAIAGVALAAKYLGSSNSESK